VDETYTPYSGFANLVLSQEVLHYDILFIILQDHAFSVPTILHFPRISTKIYMLIFLLQTLPLNEKANVLKLEVFLYGFNFFPVCRKEADLKAFVRIF